MDDVENHWSSDGRVDTGAGCGSACCACPELRPNPGVGAPPRSTGRPAEFEGHEADWPAGRRRHLGRVQGGRRKTRAECRADQGLGRRSAGPRPPVAEPHGRQDVEGGRLGPAIPRGDLDEHLRRRMLGVLDEIPDHSVKFWLTAQSLCLGGESKAVAFRQRARAASAPQ